MIHGHGDDSYRFKHKVQIDFSTNVWHEGAPSSLLNHLQNSLSSTNHYPEPDAGALRMQIADHHGVMTDNVLVLNGSVEGIYLLAQRFQNKRSVIRIPTFAEYEDACTMYGHQLSFIRGAISHEKIGQETELLWFCNPNNPTSDFEEPERLRLVIEKHPDTLFVADEAYESMGAEPCSLVSAIPQYTNVIVLRSLTKSFAIPGLRLGYLLASQEIVQKLEALCMPWRINSLACAGGSFVMNNYESLKPNRKRVNTQTQAFVHQLQQLEGFTFYDACAPFILGQVHRGSAALLKAFLLDEAGILIRNASNFRGLSDRYFRIGVRSDGDNQKLLQALKKWNSQSLYSL